ncbi:signal peptidase I [Sphingomonas sp. C3-2]|uniref:signal peptidase I n=1 Tax=Sphingomonas sp. C3-2 TaxID=3062169 RepID=UPI00294B10D2|nr:signal peptidase I [Sphingomonas sp. C3-2]WOK36213.1 signal peptidase I [Sphingomonas sp. C3-2]
MNDTTPASAEPMAGPATKKKSETLDFLGFLLKLGILVFVIRSFIAAPFNIPSESMMPRLLVGDYLLVSKWNYGYSNYSLPFDVPLIPGRILPSTPERGDVVVFKAPPHQRQDYIKRVIGLPGDTVEISDGQVILNGKPVSRVKMDDIVLPETPTSNCLTAASIEQQKDGRVMCRYPRFRETLPNGKSYFVLDTTPRTAGDDTQLFTVPEGHIFLMGDNRDHSADSRFPAADNGAIGMVPVDNLVGKAWVSVFSTDGNADWLKPWTWVTAARWSRIGEGF